MPLPSYEERLEFARDLQSGIGSSDAPELMGCGFHGAGKVWYSKFCDLDEIARVPVDGRLRRGLMLEPMVAAEYTQHTGVELVKAERARHPDRPWQRASPDYRRVKDDRIIVELKAIDFFEGSEWGPMLSDRVPEKYRVQATHQMGVCGDTILHLCATAVLTWETRIYAIPFDAALFDKITAVEAEFWEKFVVGKVPPPAGWEDKNKGDYKDRSNGDSKAIVALGEDVAEACARRALLKGLVKEAEAEIDQIGEFLLDAMGAFPMATAGDWTLTKRHTKGTEKRRESYWVATEKAVTNG